MSKIVQIKMNGIVGVTLNPAIAANYRLSVETGSLLVELPRGPSSRAGLKPGDVIISINDEAITGMEQLREIILSKKVAEKVRTRFARGNDIFEVNVELFPAP